MEDFRYPLGSAIEHLDMLAGALIERGLVAMLLRGNLLRASNPATGSDAPGSLLRHPGLQQLIACQPNRARGGALWFWWLWSATDRDIDPLCPADDIDTAATRIARVLSPADP